MVGSGIIDILPQWDAAAGAAAGACFSMSLPRHCMRGRRCSNLPALVMLERVPPSVETVFAPRYLPVRLHFHQAACGRGAAWQCVQLLAVCQASSYFRRYRLFCAVKHGGEPRRSRNLLQPSSGCLLAATGMVASATPWLLPGHAGQWLSVERATVTAGFTDETPTQCSIPDSSAGLAHAVAPKLPPGAGAPLRPAMMASTIWAGALARWAVVVSHVVSAVTAW